MNDFLTGLALGLVLWIIAIFTIGQEPYHRLVKHECMEYTPAGVLIWTDNNQSVK